MSAVKRTVPALAVVMVMMSVFFVGCLGGGNNGYTISPQGTVIQANGGKLTINVPADAVTSTQTIQVQVLSADDNLTGFMRGCSYEITPEDLNFSRAVQLMIEFDHTDLPEGVNESELHPCRANSCCWDDMMQTEVHMMNDTVTLNITHLGIFSVSWQTQVM